MTFPEALAAVFNSNARITRRTWANSRAYLCRDSRDQVCTTWNSETGSADGLLHPWIMTSEDYYSTDWEVVE